MVKLIATSGNFVATVTVKRFNGEQSEFGRFPKSTDETPAPSDVFDYAAQALGYFRFHIAEMSDVESIEIEVSNYNECVELTSITRD